MAWNAIVAGIFIWIIPFAVSCFVIMPDENGNLIKILDEHDFKTLMMISGSIASTFAAIKSAPRTGRDGMNHALVTLLVNWALDLLVLVPLMVPETTNSKLTLKSWSETVPVWFKEIGSKYVGFVLIFVAAGCNAQAAVKELEKEKNS